MAAGLIREISNGQDVGSFEMSSKSHDIHVLGIESSCDDTGVAILKNDGKVLANCMHSQLKKHLNHGGIIPMVAKEYHLENIDRIARRAFEKSSLNSIGENIDAIAVTTRPGLNYSLQVGLNYARQLAKKYSKPLIPIHHMQAHALMPLLENRSIRFPFMALLLSGGHCLISICRRFNQFELLGASLDNAPGDLLDKIARRCRLKNLGPPFDGISGGAAIELLSSRQSANRFKYFNTEESVPMLTNRGCDLSFSGYRGTFELLVPYIDELWKNGDRDLLLDELSHLSGSIQRAILIQISKKLQRAIGYYRMFWRYQNLDAFKDDGEYKDKQLMNFGIRSVDENDYLDIVVSGGVAANDYFISGLREICHQEFDERIQVYAPSRSLCSDNGLMIAWNGLLRYTDYLSDREKYRDTPLDNNVIADSDKMSCLDTSPESPIGTDIRQLVNLADFKMRRFQMKELKLSNIVSSRKQSEDTK